jgi:hypothetical protein
MGVIWEWIANDNRGFYEVLSTTVDIVPVVPIQRDMDFWLNFGKGTAIEVNRFRESLRCPWRIGGPGAFAAALDKVDGAPAHYSGTLGPALFVLEVV